VEPRPAFPNTRAHNKFCWPQGIEAAAGLKTCIVYGALPAETRRHQVGTWVTLNAQSYNMTVALTAATCLAMTSDQAHL
jgi:hypothetical protein